MLAVFTSPPDMRFVTVAPVRFTPDTSHDAMLMPVRSAAVRLAPRSMTLGPTMNVPGVPVPRATYPAGRVAVVAPMRPPVVTPVRMALVRTAFVKFTPVKTTFDKSTPVAAALASETPGPTINPPRTK